MVTVKRINTENRKRSIYWEEMSLLPVILTAKKK